MSWNLTDVSFDESVGTGLIVDFVNTTNSLTGISPDEVEIQDIGIMAAWHTTGGEPEVTTRHTWFVPWSNIRALHQSGVVA